MSEACEWKLEPKGSVKRIEQLVGCPVYAFANNGFGDHLFLKEGPDAGVFDAAVYEFFHEGPEVKRIEEDLETLLGLKERPPSVDGYPKAIYATGELVQLRTQRTVGQFNPLIADVGDFKGNTLRKFSLDVEIPLLGIADTIAAIEKYGPPIAEKQKDLMDWLTGLVGSTLAYRKARRLFGQSRYVIAGVFLTVAVAAVARVVGRLSVASAGSGPGCWGCPSSGW